METSDISLYVGLNSSDQFVILSFYALLAEMLEVFLIIIIIIIIITTTDFYRQSIQLTEAAELIDDKSPSTHQPMYWRMKISSCTGIAAYLRTKQLLLINLT